MAGARIPPGTTAVARRLPGTVFVYPALHQFPLTGFRAFPLPPRDGSQLAPEPAIKVFEDAFGVRQPEVLAPAAWNRGDLRDNPGKRVPASPPERGLQSSVKIPL